MSKGRKIFREILDWFLAFFIPVVIVFFLNMEEIKSYVVGTTPAFDGKYPITVPPGKLFVMGDNRKVSRDSRSFGCIDVRSVEGKAVMILWPLNRVGRPQ